MARRTKKQKTDNNNDGKENVTITNEGNNNDYENDSNDYENDINDNDNVINDENDFDNDNDINDNDNIKNNENDFDNDNNKQNDNNIIDIDKNKKINTIVSEIYHTYIFSFNTNYNYIFI